MMRILSADPGLADCGWAILRFRPGQKAFCEASGSWKTEPHPDTAKRISNLGLLFDASLYGIHLVALEGWTFQGDHRTHASSTTVPRVIERFRTLAELRKIPVLEVTQQAAKAALGVRHKRDVARAVGILVDHEHKVPNRHAADAVAVAIAAERRWRRMMAEGRVA